MKKIIVSSLFIISCTYAWAQYPLAKGKTQINAGFGFSTWGLPVYLGLDYGVHKDISIGGEASFRSYQNKFSGVSYSHSIIGLAVNGNYHFNELLEIRDNKWDVYAGATIGFYIWRSDNNYKGSGASGLGFGAQLGGRYYFSERMGINLELGGGNAFSTGKLGITIKL